MQTAEQQRAANALERVESLNGTPNQFKVSYRAYVDRLGPAIVMNGLGQAMATELAAAGSGSGGRDTDAHQQLYENMQAWLCRNDGGVYAGANSLLQAIINGDQSKYILAQAEALSWLDWHKKCCRAIFPEGTAE